MPTSHAPAALFDSTTRAPRSLLDTERHARCFAIVAVAVALAVAVAAAPARPASHARPRARLCTTVQACCVTCCGPTPSLG